MDVFGQKEKIEEKAYAPFYDKETENKEKEEESQKAVLDIIRDREHSLSKLMTDPYWIKKAIESNGKKVGQSFKENLKQACEIIAQETGYDKDLIQQVYEAIKKEETTPKWEQKKVIH